MRAVYTLFWEQFRQSWRGLGLILGAVVGYWLLLFLVEDLVFIIFSNNPRIALAAAFAPVVGGIGIMLMQETRGQISFAYPRRNFWIPVHTYALVGTQLVFKIALVAALAIAAGWICATEIKLTFAIFPQVLMFTSLTAALLGLVFLTCGYGAGTGFALFIPAFGISLIGFGPVLAAVNYNFSLVMPPSAYDLARIGLTPETATHLYVYPEFSRSVWWAGIATPLWWALVCYVAARHARSEVPGDRIGRWVRVVTNVAYMDRDSDSFASPEAAQRWYEWRRVTYLFPWLATAIGIVLIATLQSSLEAEENKFVVGFSLFVLAPAITAVLVGYTMTRPDPRNMWFIGGRPLTTSAISRIRLMVSVKALAIAYALLMITYIVANAYFFRNWNPLDSLITDMQLVTSTYGSSGSGAVMLLGTAWIVLLVIWSLFWLGRVAGFVAWIAAMLASAYFYLEGGTMFAARDSEIVSPVWNVFGGTLTVLMLAGIVFAYGFSVYRRLLSVKLLPVLAIVLLLSLASIWAIREAIHPKSLPIVFVWLLVPFAPFASVPATLTWQRHR